MLGLRACLVWICQAPCMLSDRDRLSQQKAICIELRKERTPGNLACKTMQSLQGRSACMAPSTSAKWLHWPRLGYPNARGRLKTGSGICSRSCVSKWGQLRKLRQCLAGHSTPCLTVVSGSTGFPKLLLRCNVLGDVGNLCCSCRCPMQDMQIGSGHWVAKWCERGDLQGIALGSVNAVLRGQKGCVEAPVTPVGQPTTTC